MLVTNDVSTDTRVKKEALAVARMGLTVTVLGTTTESHRWETMLGDVRILRVPVEFTLRNERVRRRNERRRAPLATALAKRTTQPALAARSAAAPPAAAPPGSVAGAGGADAPGVTGVRPGLPGSAWAQVRRLARPGRRLYRKALRARKVYLGKTARAGDRTYRRAWAAYDARIGKVPYNARWRILLPEIIDYERALAPVIDELRPDVLHAHDMQVVGIAAEAVERARSAGREVPWIYDAHEFVPGLSQYGDRTRRVIAAWTDLEQEYVHSATRVITVSSPISAELQRIYRLPHPPAVVLNAPVADPSEGSPPQLRQVVGLPDSIPLRGLQRDDDHGPRRPHRDRGDEPATRRPPGSGLRSPHRTRGVSAGCGHWPRRRVSTPECTSSNRCARGRWWSSCGLADLGLLPFQHFPSHEMALANKMFEYVNAGLPVVVSDCRTQAEFVRRHRIGEVFRAGDAAGLADAVRRVLGDRATYATSASDPEFLERYSWRRQEEVLRGVYAEVLDRSLEWTDGPSDRAVVNLRESPRIPHTPAPVTGS